MAFQLRPGVIRPRTFTGAMQALLNEASDETYWRWRVEPYVREISWERWVDSVRRVKSLTIRLERPNPDYADREALEAMIEGARANVLQFAFKADPNDPRGLDTDDEFVRQAIEHADDYGDWSAVGETVEAGDVTEVRWRSEQEGFSPEATVDADPTTGEADSDDLRRELNEFEPPDEA